MTVHVELGPRLTGCLKYPSQLPEDDQAIGCNDWYTSPEVVQQATCEACLLRLFMLGDSASIALARMGRKVEVRDDPADRTVS